MGNKMIMILDRAIINALHDLMGEGANAFFLRVRDALVKDHGFLTEDANAIINAYLAQAPKSGIDLTHITGKQEKIIDGFKAVRYAIIQVINELLDSPGVGNLFVSRIAEYVKNSFSSDLHEAVEQINADIHGSPIEEIETSDDELRIKLKRDAKLIAYVLAYIRTDNPKLVSSENNVYVFRKGRGFLPSSSVTFTFHILTFRAHYIVATDKRFRTDLYVCLDCGHKFAQPVYKFFRKGNHILVKPACPRCGSIRLVMLRRITQGIRKGPMPPTNISEERIFFR